VHRNTATTIRFGADGHGRDYEEIPLVAVRELVANALIHRDLSPHTHGKRVEIRLKNDRLFITNPGGLWGVSREQLGEPGGKSAVNEFLYELAKNVRTADNSRVIEGEGGGIREVRSALRLAGLQEPFFVDTGVQFGVTVPRHAWFSAADLAWLAQTGLPLTDLQRSIAVSMRHGQVWTNALVRQELGPIDSTQARAALQGLVDNGIAQAQGQRGQRTYRLRQQPVSGEAAPPGDHDERLTIIPSEIAAISKNAAVVWSHLRDPLTKAAVVQATGLSTSQVSYALRSLESAGVLTIDGGWGRAGTTYQRR
jgi:ATP-dependent DNA helicase RecG